MIANITQRSKIMVLRPFRIPFLHNATKIFTIKKRHYKVMVAGAAGGVGQPLCMLLKQNPLITHLSLYDVVPIVKGIAVDLSHIDTKTIVTGHCGREDVSEALKGAKIVILLAGVSNRDPGSPPEFLFDANAPIVSDLATYVATVAPDAIVAVVTDPIDSMVPVVAEIMKKNRVYNPSKILGVTTLDVIRTATFTGEVNQTNPTLVNVPVIGGNTQNTIIPLFSQCKPPLNCDEARVKSLTKKVNCAYSEVTRAKQCIGSSTLSMAFAAARFANALLCGLLGMNNVIECAYVKSNVTSSPYFSTPILFGKKGVMRNLGYGKLSSFEEKLVSAAVPVIWQNIKRGEDYVRNQNLENLL